MWYICIYSSVRKLTATNLGGTTGSWARVGTAAASWEETNNETSNLVINSGLSDVPRIRQPMKMEVSKVGGEKKKTLKKQKSEQIKMRRRSGFFMRAVCDSLQWGVRWCSHQHQVRGWQQKQNVAISEPTWGSQSSNSSSLIAEACPASMSVWIWNLTSLKGGGRGSSVTCASTAFGRDGLGYLTGLMTWCLWVVVEEDSSFWRVKILVPAMDAWPSQWEEQ